MKLALSETMKTGFLATGPILCIMMALSVILVCCCFFYFTDRRFVFGNTYGDTTRGLDICSHNAPSYGEFTKFKASQSVMA